MRDQALISYREALNTIETIRAGSLRADESRTTFRDHQRCHDEHRVLLREMALLSAGAASSRFPENRSTMLLNLSALPKPAAPGR